MHTPLGPTTPCRRPHPCRRRRLVALPSQTRPRPQAPPPPPHPPPPPQPPAWETALRAAGVWLPPYRPPAPHPPVESGTDAPPVIDVNMQWEVDSGHRYVRLPDGGRLYRVCLDHSLAPHDDASPQPDPQPPWTPCHLVMWSPPTRRTTDTTTPSTAADSSAPKKKDRPYFLAELADLTIAPDTTTATTTTTTSWSTRCPSAHSSS